ncbi:hypothetical protein M430DRAFT_22838, partial [Amorphotheca resinae ATCC 22711]
MSRIVRITSSSGRAPGAPSSSSITSAHSRQRYQSSTLPLPPRPPPSNASVHQHQRYQSSTLPLPPRPPSNASVHQHQRYQSSNPPPLPPPNSRTSVVKSLDYGYDDSITPATIQELTSWAPVLPTEVKKQSTTDWLSAVPATTPSPRLSVGSSVFDLLKSSSVLPSVESEAEEQVDAPQWATNVEKVWFPASLSTPHPEPPYTAALTFSSPSSACSPRPWFATPVRSAAPSPQTFCYPPTSSEFSVPSHSSSDPFLSDPCSVSRPAGLDYSVAPSTVSYPASSIGSSRPASCVASDCAASDSASVSAVSGYVASGSSAAVSPSFDVRPKIPQRRKIAPRSLSGGSRCSSRFTDSRPQPRPAPVPCIPEEKPPRSPILPPRRTYPTPAWLTSTNHRRDPFEGLLPSRPRTYLEWFHHTGTWGYPNGKIDIYSPPAHILHPLPTRTNISSKPLHVVADDCSSVISSDISTDNSDLTIIPTGIDIPVPIPTDVSISTPPTDDSIPTPLTDNSIPTPPTDDSIPTPPPVPTPLTDNSIPTPPPVPTPPTDDSIPTPPPVPTPLTDDSIPTPPP